MQSDRKALDALLSLSQALLGASSTSQIEAILAQHSMALLETHYSLYLRYRPELDALMMTEAYGSYQRRIGYVVPRGKGVSWQVMEGQQPILQLRYTEEVPSYAIVNPHEPPQSVVYAPLRTATGELLGLLSLGRVNADFSAAEENLVATFANTGVVALQGVQKMERHATEREDVLLALGLALEARDYETKGHTERSVRLAEQLGAWVDLGNHELEALRQGAYLHDIGKLAVPDEIIRKPGPLTEAQRKTMQQHVLIGEDLVRRIPTVHTDALSVIRSHHERWDGKGYPDGLAGQDIPMLARIFSVVDVYDALTSERPYHQPRTPDDALSYLRAEAGRHFDPLAVYAFEDMLRTTWAREKRRLHEQPKPDTAHS